MYLSAPTSLYRGGRPIPVTHVTFWPARAMRRKRTRPYDPRDASGFLCHKTKGTRPRVPHDSRCLVALGHVAGKTRPHGPCKCMTLWALPCGTMFRALRFFGPTVAQEVHARKMRRGENLIINAKSAARPRRWQDALCFLQLSIQCSN